MSRASPTRSLSELSESAVGAPIRDNAFLEARGRSGELRGRGWISIGVALFLGTLALRPQIVGIGPLAEDISRSLGVSGAVVGLLTTLPILCMGLFAPLGPALAQRFEARRVMAVCLMALGLTGVLRGALGTAVPFLIATIGIGVATGAAGALPSMLAKLYVPSRAGAVSGAAAAGIVSGAMLSAALAVPLAGVMGGWRPVLGLFAGAGLVATAIWFVLLGPSPTKATPIPAAGSVGRAPLAWMLAVVFGLQAILYWGGGAWLAGTYVERGWEPAGAAALVAMLNGAALLGNVVVAVMSDRVGFRLRQIVLAAGGTALAAAGFVLLPGMAVVWTAILGFSLGAIFPLLLAYAIDASGDPRAAGSLSGFMLLVGYVIAAVGPLALGAARDLTGGFGSTFPILLIVAVSLTVASLGLRPASAAITRSDDDSAIRLGVR
jgi:CP family cyanate transporter-like MFS transporter